MLDYRLYKEELAERRAAHRKALKVRKAYRINAVILLGKGRAAEDVADALRFDPDTVRAYCKRYKKGGFEALLRMNDVGSEALAGQATVDATGCGSARTPSSDGKRWVKDQWNVCYSPSKMAVAPRRLDYVYKKPKRVPGKAAAAAHEDFLKTDENLKRSSGEDDLILFMDATHPPRNPVISYGWIKRGKTHPIKRNTGRRRLNINGAIDMQNLNAEIHVDDRIDATSTIAHFEQIEYAHPHARYYCSKAVNAYLEKSRIDLLFIPPYSATLNLIERFRKFSSFQAQRALQPLLRSLRCV
jgi:transposase